MMNIDSQSRIAKKFKVSLADICTYKVHMKPYMGERKICRLFSRSEELQYVTMKADEEMELKKFSESFRMSPTSKIELLLQCYISRMNVESASLVKDMDVIAKCANRHLRAIFEVILDKGWAELAEKALNLCRRVGRRVQTPLQQCINHHLPKLNLAASIKPLTRSLLEVELTIRPTVQWDEKINGNEEPFWVMVKDNEGKFAVSYDWFGSETILPIFLGSLILPAEDHLRPTQLSLQPLLSALKIRPHEALYQNQQFNRVQTHVFNSLYKTDDNVLIAAPSGSKKIVCAEFSILRNYNQRLIRTMRVLCISPIESLARARYTNLKNRFAKKLGLQVAILTGETATDLKLVEESQIVISTPDKWDALSRNWKERKCVQEVSLLIIDKIHLIGCEGGHVLELVVSRMRYLANQEKNRIRIVALSTSLANAKDLGEWIGASSQGLFNFPPESRSVPLEIQIKGVNFSNYDASMQEMTKQTYKVVLHHAKDGKPAIVYVPTRTNACRTATDFYRFSRGKKPMFLKDSTNLEPYTSKIKDQTLKTTLSCGVGFLHEGLSSIEKNVVSDLFGDGIIRVCVLTRSLCWGLPLNPHLVMVMGTHYYDGREKDHNDYKVSELLQMLGQAGRPLVYETGKCVILSHTPRKEHYKFLHEAFPLESYLLKTDLRDALNSEIVAGIVKSKQGAVNYLRWTFMYRRLPENPNYYYYHLQGANYEHLFDYLSELVEDKLDSLERNNFIDIDSEEKLLSPLNLGKIASEYNISCATIDYFRERLTSTTKIRDLLEILVSASEFSQLSVQPGEQEYIQRLMYHQKFSYKNQEYTDPPKKANVLLQAHFLRQPIDCHYSHLVDDQHEVLLLASRLLQAMIVVISSNEWLDRALVAMKVSQMVIQGMWYGDSVLLQLPHFTKDLVKRCQENPGKPIETLYDLVKMMDDDRRELLQLSDPQLQEVADFCNYFPDIKMAHEVNIGTLVITFNRDENYQVDYINAPRYPAATREGWWLILGDKKRNQILACKKIRVQNKLEVTLEFKCSVGTWYTLFLISDCFVGCDLEYNFAVSNKRRMVA